MDQNGDVLYVDDEGLLKPSKNWFFYRHRKDQPLAGNGMLVGREVDAPDYEGGYTTDDPQTKLADLLKDVVFFRV